MLIAYPAEALYAQQEGLRRSSLQLNVRAPESAILKGFARSARRLLTSFVRLRSQLVASLKADTSSPLLIGSQTE